jgi:hypothetical protein
MQKKIPIRSAKIFKDKDLIVFDLDGTLTETKSNMLPDMTRALGELLAEKKVAVISGADYHQFRKQFVAHIAYPKPLLQNLSLFPADATCFYRYNHGWRQQYAFRLSKIDRAKIKKAFRDVLRDIHYVPPTKTYGKVIEDRGTEVTFSALGQDVVLALGKRGVALKKKWTRENTPLKLEIARLVQKRLPRLEVHAAGFTSIDVTKRGIDKAYGVRKISRLFKVPIARMLFVGDALYPGGNDAAAKRTGVKCVAVIGPGETKRVIMDILNVGDN